jgi:hypothetical protein
MKKDKHRRRNKRKKNDLEETHKEEIYKLKCIIGKKSKEIKCLKKKIDSLKNQIKTPQKDYKIQVTQKSEKLINDDKSDFLKNFVKKHHPKNKGE